jgi:4-amino-4-deoxy-L-arabinose transferase-like glycosyltransferase
LVLLVSFLLVAAFFLRLYSASLVPFLHEEQKRIDFTAKISFDEDDLKLPIGDAALQNPILCTYVMKLGLLWLGKDRLGIRLIFLMLSVLGLFFVYRIVKKNMDERSALLVLFLLSFSQYHIGTTRLAFEGSLFFFFMPAAFYTFIRGITTRETKYVFYTGALLGFGCLSYEGMFLFALIIFLYLLLYRNHRIWLKQKEFYISLLIMLAICSPYLYWSGTNQINKLNSEHFFSWGISLRSFYLYFAELLPILNLFFPFFKWDLFEESIYYRGSEGAWNHLSAISVELPVVHWPMGILIFIGTIYCLKEQNKGELLKFSLFMFGSVFIATSLIAGAYSLFDDHWWAGMTIIPGTILCAHMLARILERHRIFGILIAVLCFYFFLHAISFVLLPESLFAVPI